MVLGCVHCIWKVTDPEVIPPIIAGSTAIGMTVVVLILFETRVIEGMEE